MSIKVDICRPPLVYVSRAPCAPPLAELVQIDRSGGMYLTVSGCLGERKSLIGP